jgi:hypothetical protein
VPVVSDIAITLLFGGRYMFDATGRALVASYIGEAGAFTEVFGVLGAGMILALNQAC